MFQEYCPHLSFDTFAHYLSDLKYRRLIRLSPKIEDDDGLASSSFFLREEDNRGEMIIISEIADQLLKITNKQ